MRKIIKSLIIICLSLIVCIVTSCDRNKNKTYEINYVTSYGELGNAVKSYDGSIDVKLPVLEDSLYEFKGWYNNVNYSGNVITTIYKGEEGNKTFYAKWVEKEKPHTHEFSEGVCSCGETDPNYVAPHIHEFLEGVCSCGETDPSYVPPHTHEFTEGVCSCGEKDPNYVVPHVHKYVNYMCECGLIDPNYSSENKLNSIGFDGNGMSYGIMVKDKSVVDPFDSNYEGVNKALEQAHQKAVETAYNIKINYVEYAEDVDTDFNHVNYIKEGVISETLKDNNIFVISTSSEYMKVFAKVDALEELYDVQSERGLFVDYDYEQNYLISNASLYRHRVYGYNPNNVYPDAYLCYNATKVKELGLEDPSEMWFKGNWNWDSFDSWVKSSSELLNVGEYVIDSGYSDFLIGASPAKGMFLANYSRDAIQLTRSIPCSIVDTMKNYYQNGYWNTNRDLSEVSNVFVEGNALLHNGSTNILKQLKYNSELDFEIGIVPYPLNTDETVTIYTEPYTYVDSEGNSISVSEPLKNRYNEVTKTSDGKEVYGIDLSKTSFQVPYTKTDCYSVLSQCGDYINGLNPSIAFSILNDLMNKNTLLPKDESLSKEQLYHFSLNDFLISEIDKEVIMSVKNYLYYDEIVRFSFNTCYNYGYDYLLGDAIKDIVVNNKDTLAILEELNKMYIEENLSFVS